MQRMTVLAGLFITGLFLTHLWGCSGGGTGRSEPELDAGGKREATTITTDDPGRDEPPAAGEPRGAESVLEGRVVFQGPLPPPRKISVTKDVEYCGKFVNEREEVVVSDSGGLVSTVVEIRGLEEPADGWKWQHPPEGYRLSQKGCAFHPPLLVMPDGAELNVFNDDPVAHNVNTGQWNLMQPGGAEPLVRSLSNRQPVRVTCNIHGWMEGWIYLAQSPYHTITDKTGRFRIEGVPPGKYRVTAWHPSLRSQRATVEFPAGVVVQHEFVFDSPFSE